MKGEPANATQYQGSVNHLSRGIQEACCWDIAAVGRNENDLTSLIWCCHRATRAARCHLFFGSILSIHKRNLLAGAYFFTLFAISLQLQETKEATMKWEKLKPPEPDDPMCCCECDGFHCCDCEDLDEAFNRSYCSHTSPTRPLLISVCRDTLLSTPTWSLFSIM